MSGTSPVDWIPVVGASVSRKHARATQELEKELQMSREQVAQEVEKQQKQMQNFQEATAMLKEHSQKFKEQDEQHWITGESAQLLESQQMMHRLVTQVKEMRNEVTGAEERLFKQMEREKLEKEVVRESLVEIRLQMKAKKERP
eukprot:Skav212518  [mRNA]  locus=scaffold1283:97261:110072:- [translate_table: standard]